MSVIAETLIGRRSGAARAAREALLIVGGSLVVAALAQLSIRLPFTPVPVTGQTLGVLLVGVALGPARGGAALALYLAEGAAGLPVFAEGAAGWAYLVLRDPLHASGGYLWGFLAAAVAVGWLARMGWDRSVAGAVGAMLVGNAIIYLFGVPWLASALGVSIADALGFGLYPFVAGDLIKVSLAGAILPGTWRLIGTDRGR